MSLDFTDDQSTLVQVMAWYRQATSHYLSQCWPRSLSPYGVTRPQWVKNMQAGMHTPLILNTCQECMEFCSTLRGTRIPTKLRLYLGYELLLDHYKLVIRSWVISLSLQNFYKNEIDRQEMYIRYIYKLRDLHRACESYTEAGFTLLLHAELLPWGNAMLPADLGYPAQMQWQRKEELYLKIINYFDRGKVGTGNRKKKWLEDKFYDLNFNLWFLFIEDEFPLQPSLHGTFCKWIYHSNKP